MNKAEKKKKKEKILNVYKIFNYSKLSCLLLTLDF